MMHKFCFEALDKSLRDIMSYEDNAFSIFEGKMVMLGGDFRQILLVILRGNHFNIVHATTSNTLYIWDHCQVLSLMKNMCVQHNGKIFEPNDCYALIEIPGYLFNMLFIHFCYHITLNLSCYISDEREYLSSNPIDKLEGVQTQAFEVLTIEFLSFVRTSSLLNHKIKLKIGTPVMLLRNLDQYEGLCNNNRLIVTRLANYVIGAKIMFGNNIESMIYISQMYIEIISYNCLICYDNQQISRSIISKYTFLDLCIVMVNCMWHILKFKVNRN
ncbi:hypothetical protein CR513_19624, partial [Mucuna pruriens]